MPIICQIFTSSQNNRTHESDTDIKWYQACEWYQLSRVNWTVNDGIIIRGSRPELFCKKDVLRNFAKFTGKHLCQSLVFNKVATLRPANLLEKSLWHWYFHVNFVKFLRAPFFIEHLWWLFLHDYQSNCPKFVTTHEGLPNARNYWTQLLLIL